MFTVNNLIISVDRQKLKKESISEQKLKEYFPRYILEPTPIYYGRVKYIWFFIIRMFLTIWVKIFLRPRGSSGKLDNVEIGMVYDKKAKSYDRKHHITTRGMDLIWRRACGWFVSVIGRNKVETLELLDLCSGTGLTVKEMISILREWNINANYHVFDFSKEMLKLARRNLNQKNISVSFEEGNAMNMKNISSDYFDVVTQMFGIGGIEKPQKVFEEVLRILKPNGHFFMVDMHQPISEYPGEWPFFLKWYQFPTLESVIYRDTTMPLVLNRLWGWRDTTLCFYFLPLATYEDNGFWGFKIRFFEYEPQRWWFALPIMPTGKIVVEKVQISKNEFEKRKVILNACKPIS